MGVVVSGLGTALYTRSEEGGEVTSCIELLEEAVTWKSLGRGFEKMTCGSLMVAGTVEARVDWIQ